MTDEPITRPDVLLDVRVVMAGLLSDADPAGTDTIIVAWRPMASAKVRVAVKAPRTLDAYEVERLIRAELVRVLEELDDMDLVSEVSEVSDV